MNKIGNGLKKLTETSQLICFTVFWLYCFSLNYSRSPLTKFLEIVLPSKRIVKVQTKQILQDFLYFLNTITKNFIPTSKIIVTLRKGKEVVIAIITALFTELPWPEGTFGVFESSSHLPNCGPNTKASHCTLLSLNVKQGSFGYQFL